MNEEKNTASAAVEEALAAVRNLIETVESKEDMKTGLEDVISRLAGKISDTGKAAPAADESAADAEEEETDGGDDDDAVCTHLPSSELSDIFTEDALAGLAVGFVAGAAVVGGGVLIHKLLTK